MPWSVIEDNVDFMTFRYSAQIKKIADFSYETIIVKPIWLVYKQFSRVGTHKSTIRHTCLTWSGLYLRA